jgi:hypothetical protein
LRLNTRSQQLGSLYKRLRDSPTAQIDRALQLLAKEVSNGRHETSTATSLTTTAVDPEDDSGWEQIKRDLGDLGVEEKTVSDHKEFITDWILRAINDGTLTDEKIPVEPDTMPIPLSPPPKPPKTPLNQIPSLQPLGPPPDYPPKLTVITPTRQPSVSLPGLRPAVSTDVLNQFSSINMDEPPSPIEPEPAESNILWNAQRITHHWNAREWSQARENLEAQLACVQRGEVVDVSGFPQQPDERIIKHLLGVCQSFSGDFLKAGSWFQDILSGHNINQLALDDGDIAAARWLGETCILTNQVLNANLAWALAYYGIIVKHPPHIPGNKDHQRMLDDLRLLHERTGGLNALKNAFTNSNRDASTILPNMAGTIKFQVVTTALEAFKMYPLTHPEPRNLNQSINVAEGFLIQPLVAQKAWPFPQDPFFQVRTCVDLLFALSRPRTAFVTASIPTSSLGSSKYLTYVTKHSIDFLVEAIRHGLNTYSVEWKIRHGEYLLRLSQTHDRIAFYDVFIVKFRKLPFRNVYGFKISDSMYITRNFTGKWQHLSAMSDDPEVTRKAKVRNELAERLKEYVQQAEQDLARGQWPPQEFEDPNARAPYEIDSNTVLLNELSDSRGNASEMPGQGVVRRKPVQTAPRSYEMIAELPG